MVAWMNNTGRLLLIVGFLGTGCSTDSAAFDHDAAGETSSDADAAVGDAFSADAPNADTLSDSKSDGFGVVPSLDVAPDSVAVGLGVEFGDGARLKARQHAFSGAPPALVGWRDEALAMDCNFANMFDGIQRCVPDILATLHYSDAACTKLMALPSDLSCDLPPTAGMVSVMQTDECGDQRADVYIVSGLIFGQMTYAMVADGCIPAGEEGWSYTNVEQADPDALVNGLKKNVAINDELAAAVRTASDGSHELVELFDTNRNRACFPVGRDEGGFVCQERRAATGSDGDFVYQSCDGPAVAYRTATACEKLPPTVVRHWQSQSCGVSTTSYSDVGEMLKATDVLDGSSCSAAGFQQQYFAVGPAAVLPKMTEAWVGYGRIKRRGISLQGSAEKYLGPPVWFDSEKQTQCTPTEVGSVVRCVPNETVQFEPIVAGSFLDDSCTVEGFEIQELGGCGPQVPSLVRRRSPFEDCLGKPAYAFVVATPSDLKSYYQLQGEDCVGPLPLDEELVLYSLGEEVPPSEFAQAGNGVM